MPNFLLDGGLPVSTGLKMKSEMPRSGGTDAVPTIGEAEIFKINKNAKMFTKWVAVARESLLTIAFCIIFRAPPHGDARFGQNPYF